jgi:hypothetical protein
MNIRAAFVRRFPGRNRMIDDIAGLMDDIRRLRRIRFWRLFDHEELALQK